MPHHANPSSPSPVLVDLPWGQGDWQGQTRTLSQVVHTYADRYGMSMIGDDVSVDGVAGLEEARPSSLSFALANIPAATLIQSAAGAIIAHPKWQEILVAAKRSAIITPSPYPLFAHLAGRFFSQPRPCSEDARNLASIHSPLPDDAQIGAFSVIGKGVSLGRGCCIGSHVSIGDGVVLGDGVWIYPHVTLYPRTRIGNGVMIHAGAVIGADGFGFQPDVHLGIRHWVKVPQIATVRIGDRVEIGANVCIDRGALTDTIVGDDCKFDNQVHIGHGCVIGKRNLFMPQFVMGGSTTTGDDCMFGGQVGVGPGVAIADLVTIHPKAAVFKDISIAGDYSGAYPLQKHREWLRTQAKIRSLD